MKRDDKLPELLAPAGSFEHLHAAIKAGADAVYLGGQHFGARAYADNFSAEKIIEGLRFAHFHNRKIYLTVNTLVKNHELQERLYDFLTPLYEEGLDGVIVQDIGAAAFIGEAFPEMELHGSTQMTITSVHGAKAAARLGMNRVVPARELTLDELIRMKRETGLELEVFVHGALCYCYSGKCLFSSMYGGRSGNRGRCAQPCRLPYTLFRPDGTACSVPLPGKYLLSPKDLCALSELPALIEAGMDSFKIEGRMKSVDYVAGVTAIYRKYMDEYARCRPEKKNWNIKKEDMDSLEELYSRGSFTEGYWNGNTGFSMMTAVHPGNLGRKIGVVSKVSGHQVGISLDRGETLNPKDVLIIPTGDQDEIALTVPEAADKRGKLLFFNIPKGKRPSGGTAVYRRKNEALAKKIEGEILKKTIKYPVTGKITILGGQKTKLSLSCRGCSVAIASDVAQRSQNRPITKEDVFRQMNKTGQSPFYLEDFQIVLDDNVFLPMSKLKNLRQEGFVLLQKRMEEKNRKSLGEVKDNYVIHINNNKTCTDITAAASVKKTRKRIAFLYNEEMSDHCREEKFFDSVCLPAAFWQRDVLINRAEEFRQEGKEVYLSLPEVLRFSGEERITDLCRLPVWSGIYVHDLGQAEFVYECIPEGTGIRASASFYHWNRMALAASSSLFALQGVELPLELSREECIGLAEGCPSSLDLEWMVYGRPAVMRSAQCLKKTCGLCNNKIERLWLEDSRGRRLPAISHCDYCYSSLWMDTPKNHIGEEIGSLAGKINAFGFHLMTETGEELTRLIKCYTDWEQHNFRAAGNRHDGHWNKGIE